MNSSMDALIERKSELAEIPHGSLSMPALIRRAGGAGEKRFLEFFAAQIRNRNTRTRLLP